MRNVLSLVATLVLAGTAWADGPAGERSELRGTVDAVKSAQNQLVIRPEGQELTTLHVDKDTTIFIDGRTASLADLKEGQEVRASFEMKEGEKHANWIEVTTKMMPGEEKPAEPQPAPTTPGSPDQPQNPDTTPY